MGGWVSGWVGGVHVCGVGGWGVWGGGTVGRVPVRHVRMCACVGGHNGMHPHSPMITPSGSSGSSSSVGSSNYHTMRQ